MNSVSFSLSHLNSLQGSKFIPPPFIFAQFLHIFPFINSKVPSTLIPSPEFYNALLWHIFPFLITPFSFIIIPPPNVSAILSEIKVLGPSINIFP